MAKKDPLIGTVLQGTYAITRRIGTGGMGTVYEAAHVRVDRNFAVKVLNCTLDHDEQVTARFKREAMIGSRLGHDHIVPVLDFAYTNDGNPYLIMELLDGVSLGQVMRSAEGPVPMVRACSVVRQVCRALAAAHDEGVVHRDLKPDNIYLCPRHGGGEQVKVMDFGISKVLSSESILTGQATVLGTPWYMSPEQAAGKSDEVDHRSDIFSLGVVFYQMLTGTRPFEGETIPGVLYEVVTSAPPPLEEVRPDLPPGVAAVVNRALQKKREERCSSVNKLVADLSRALGQRWTEVLMAELGGEVLSEPELAEAAAEDAGGEDTMPALQGEPDAGAGSALDDTMMAELPGLTASQGGAVMLVEAVHEEMPLDAEVYLDEELLGRTPAKLQGLSPGRHSLRLVCEGYRPVSRSVILENGMREQIRVTLFKA